MVESKLRNKGEDGRRGRKKRDFNQCQCNVSQFTSFEYKLNQDVRNGPELTGLLRRRAPFAGTIGTAAAAVTIGTATLAVNVAAAAATAARQL